MQNIQFSEFVRKCAIIACGKGSVSCDRCVRRSALKIIPNIISFLSLTYFVSLWCARALSKGHQWISVFIIFSVGIDFESMKSKNYSAFIGRTWSIFPHIKKKTKKNEFPIPFIHSSIHIQMQWHRNRVEWKFTGFRV